MKAFIKTNSVQFGAQRKLWSTVSFRCLSAREQTRLGYRLREGVTRQSRTEIIVLACRPAVKMKVLADGLTYGEIVRGPKSRPTRTERWRESYVDETGKSMKAEELALSPNDCWRRAQAELLVARFQRIETLSFILIDWAGQSLTRGPRMVV